MSGSDGRSAQKTYGSVLYGHKLEWREAMTRVMCSNSLVCQEMSGSILSHLNVKQKTDFHHEALQV